MKYKIGDVVEYLDLDDVNMTNKVIEIIQVTNSECSFVEYIVEVTGGEYYYVREDDITAVYKKV